MAQVHHLLGSVASLLRVAVSRRLGALRLALKPHSRALPLRVHCSGALALGLSAKAKLAPISNRYLAVRLAEERPLARFFLFRERGRSVKRMVFLDRESAAKDSPLGDRAAGAALESELQTPSAASHPFPTLAESAEKRGQVVRRAVGCLPEGRRA